MRPLLAAALLVLAPLPALACGFQSHALGGFIAFDAEGGWWAFDGWFSFDALTEDALDRSSHAELIRYDADGWVVEVRPIPRETLDAAYAATEVKERLDLGGGASVPVRVSPAEEDLAEAAAALLSDRTLIAAVPGLAEGHRYEAHAPIAEGCPLHQMLLHDGQTTAVRQIQGIEASPMSDGTVGENGRGTSLSGSPRFSHHPTLGITVAEERWGGMGYYHARSRTTHLVSGAGGQRTTDARCGGNLGRGMDHVPGAWFARSSPKLAVYAAPDEASTMRTLTPPGACVWGHAGEDGWVWLPGRGWSRTLTEGDEQCP